MTKTDHYNALKARDAFESITGSSYYGMQFYDCLRRDQEAFEAAVKLGERLRANRVKGSGAEFP